MSSILPSFPLKRHIHTVNARRVLRVAVRETFLLTLQRRPRYSFVMAKGVMGRADVLQETVDLMALRTVDTMGPLRGYGIARRLELLGRA